MTGDSFSFHGDVTFINRPIDTVISDFQNTYVTPASDSERQVLEDLEALLRLVLSSTALNEDVKEEAAAAVHDAANQVTSGKASKLTVKGILTAIKESISHAADIAGPAATLIQAIGKALGL